MGFIEDSIKRLQEMAEQGDPNARQAQAMFGAFGQAFTKIAEGAVAGMVQDQQRAERRAEFAQRAARLGLSTDASGGLTWESRVKVLEFIATAVNARMNLLAGDSISVQRGNETGHVSNRHYTFTTASNIIGDPKGGDHAADAFRRFLDSVNIRYTERVARNIAELVKWEKGTTHVFTVTPGNVPYNWDQAGDIDLEEALSRLLNALAPASARESEHRDEPYREPSPAQRVESEILASLSTVPDLPVPIGPKAAWYAVKAFSSQDVEELMELVEISPANWETGVAAASRSNYVFVSPPVRGYVYVIGRRVASRRYWVNSFGTSLPQQFPQLMYFGSHPDAGYHCWAKCEGGELVRFYAHSGENGQVESVGAFTREEIGLGFDQFPQSADGYSEDARFPNAEDVLTIAAAWGVDPSFAGVDVQPGCGYLCQGEGHIWAAPDDDENTDGAVDPPWDW